MRSFLNRKRSISYFILQVIPDGIFYLKCSKMQLHIRRWYIICMCKISVRNDIVKDIVKKKNDVRHNTYTITFNQRKSLQQVQPVPLVYTGVGRVYGGLGEAKSMIYLYFQKVAMLFIGYNYTRKSCC